MIYLVIIVEALRFNIDVPFWCSFSDFSSLNIKFSYPFPPVTTLFGMIQNAMGKPALHEISKEDKKIVKFEYINQFNSLKFSIILNDPGNIVEDFTNIHKGNREIEAFQNSLGECIKNIFKNESKEVKDTIKHLKSYEFYSYLKSNNEIKKYDKVLKIIRSNNCVYIFDVIKRFWISNSNGLKVYNCHKNWISTQINHQKIINPKFTIYITSSSNEYSIYNIKNALKNPVRLLYLGESDDVVDIHNIEIVDIVETKSSNISSVLLGIHQNSQLVNVPFKLKYDEKVDRTRNVCSIPNGEIENEIDSYMYDGENFVFL